MGAGRLEATFMSYGPRVIIRCPTGCRADGSSQRARGQIGTGRSGPEQDRFRWFLLMPVITDASAVWPSARPPRKWSARARCRWCWCDKLPRRKALALSLLLEYQARHGW